MYSVSERYKTEIQKAQRRVGLWGDMLLMDTAEIKRFDESNILSGGKFKLTRRISSSGLDLGGVRPAEISVMLKGFGDFADNMGGAGVVPRFRLYFNNEEHEDVPLGVFWIDADSIKRRKTEVSFRAYDNLLKFDVALPVGFSAARLNTAVFNACAAVGVGYDTAEINSLPNADINIFIDTSQIQTLRDFLMWAAQITGCFVYCDRNGKLRFKRIQGVLDENGMIIPVREIQGNNRFSTSFSDNTVRITKLFMRRNGESISKQQIYGTANSNENRMALELNDNPLLKNKSASVVEDIMAGILSKANNGLSTALFRPFETKFNGDPALDLGDYIRMRGGVIDTTRGYVTGMITSDTWTFRGGHTIKCEAQSSVLADIATETATAKTAISTFSSTSDTENKQIQVKSQLEKRVDSLETRGTGIRAAYGVALTASTTKQPLISIAYSATSTAYVSYHATLIFNVTTAGAIKFILEQDGRVVQEYVQSYNAGLDFCAITYALTATNGAHTAVLGVVSDGGIATFEAGKSQAHILSGDISKEIPWDGTISAAEKIPCIAFGAPSMSPLSYTAAPTISKPTPINQIITAAMPAISFGELSATILTITDSLIMQGQTANYTDYTTVVVTFKNPVYADGGTLDLGAWSIYGAISGVPTAIDITAYAISADGKKITFTTANFAGYDSGVFVSYDEVGNLRNSLDNTAVTGFIVSMIKT